MSHQIKTIAVGDRFRVGLHADLDAENPRILSDPATGAFTHGRSPYASEQVIDVEPGRDDHLDVSYAYERADERANTAHPELVVIRWARIFYQVTVIDDGRTLWWVDREWMRDIHPDLEPGTPKYVAAELEVIAADQAEYKTWAEGDVYGITIERKVDWTRIGPGDPDRLTTWENVDALWGIYFDDDDTSDEAVLKYATTELDVDDEFRTAVSALNETSQEASA